MTTQEVARACKCSTQIVHNCRRDGYLYVEKRSGPKGGVVYDWPPDTVNIVRGYLNRPKRAPLPSAKFNDIRAQCAKFNVPCVLHDIGSTCDYCPRSTRYEEVSAVVCDTLADIEHLAEVV